MALTPVAADKYVGKYQSMRPHPNGHYDRACTEKPGLSHNTRSAAGGP